jgi:LuxR family transcriptional regulator, maltose regulon positive regulatory protein
MDESPGDNTRRRPPGGVDELLATKVFVPRLPAGLVSRPRLSVRLEDGLRRGFILVTAPAGFGKTVLLADWATQLELPLAWLSLDTSDNDPVRFWRHVAHALDRVVAGIAELVRPLLETPGPSLERVVTTIVNTLAAVPMGVMLVLDDYHVIEIEPVHDSLLLFLEHVPPEVAVVVATRADPPMPLARRRASGRLVELRATDLRFTGEEAAILLRRLAGPETVLPDDAVAALAARTEGWAAGLQLAALSLRGSSDVARQVASFSGSHRFILDYLTEEVLAHQPEVVQQFLLEASVLGVLSGPLCDAVTDRTDSQDMLEAVERANLFLVPLDDDRGWWRFHHLFGDLLYARVQRQRPARVLELHRGAAAWHDEHGIVDEAVKHALAADDGAWAVRLVERHVDFRSQESAGRLMSTEYATIQRWLRVLPAEAVAAQPRLLLAQGRLAALAGRVDEADDLLDAAERAYANATDDRAEPSVGRLAGPLANVPAVVAAHRMFTANLRGDPDSAADFASRVLAEIGEDEWMLEAVAQVHLGVAGWTRGNPWDAERAVASVVERWVTRGVFDFALVWSFILGRIQSAQGRLGAAESTYRRALEVDVPAGLSQRPGAGAVLVGMAELAYQRDEPDTAQRHLDAAIPLCRALSYTQPLATGLAIQASIDQANGDLAGADAAMAEALAVISPAVVALQNPVPAMNARLRLDRGEVDAAQRWATDRGLTVDAKPDYVREPEYLVLARVLLRQGRSVEALQLLDRLHVNAVEHSRGGSIIEIQALRAIALADRDDDGAVAALTEALSLARPEGYVRVFADEGRPMAALLGQLIAAGARSTAVPADYLGRLMRAFIPGVPGAVPPTEDVRGLVTRLSVRELEVLRLLAAGRANREIAGELFVSPHTVKKHVTHILDKLGAANRTSAVARARDLGLLD